MERHAKHAESLKQKLTMKQWRLFTIAKVKMYIMI
jgi:hypothetical protein